MQDRFVGQGGLGWVAGGRSVSFFGWSVLGLVEWLLASLVGLYRYLGGHLVGLISLVGWSVVWWVNPLVLIGWLLTRRFRWSAGC